MAYLKYAATRQLLTTMGQDQDNSQWLSSVSVMPTCNAELTKSPAQASLKKVMTMLGCVQHCQVYDDQTLEISCPAASNHNSESYKALMVEAQRLQLEY